MGYRHHFYLIEKDLVELIRSFDKERLYQWADMRGILDKAVSDDEEPYLPLYQIGPEIFSFGDYDNAKAIQDTGTPLFTNQHLQDRYDHYEPYIVGKDGVLAAIAYNKQLIINLYERMLLRTDEQRLEEDFDERSREKMLEQHVQSMYREWKSELKGDALDLHENREQIVSSWKHEYAIFELARIYKHTDWNKYDFLFMGW